LLVIATRKDMIEWLLIFNSPETVCHAKAKETAGAMGFLIPKFDSLAS
jgi:hypothetical protein